MQESLMEGLKVLLPFPKDERELQESLSLALEDYRRTGLGHLPDTLRSPLFFGLLTLRILQNPRASREAKLRACWTLFDVIPLPETDAQVFSTEGAVPRGLQETASFLLMGGEFVEYHLLHLIYAMYLDPERAAQGPFRVLRENLDRLMLEEIDERSKLLYAYLLLSSPALTDRQAVDLLNSLLTGTCLSEESRRGLCLASMDATFSVTWFADMAREEGLYPAEVDGKEGPIVEARVRPLPSCLAIVAEDWLLAATEMPSSHEGG